MDFQQLRKEFVVLGLSVATLVVSLFVVGGGLKVVQLPPENTPVGQISQSLAVNGSIPGFKTDYTLKNERYFDANRWFVAQIAPVGQTEYSGWIVLHKNNGIFQPVVGPGTAFSDSDIVSLPPDVSSYLLERGVVYGS